MSWLIERNQRILTTHSGSLPRPDALSAMLLARMRTNPYDAAELALRTRESVATTAKKQTELGIDIVSDGEQSKTPFHGARQKRTLGIHPGAASGHPGRGAGCANRAVAPLSMFEMPSIVPPLCEAHVKL